MKLSVALFLSSGIALAAASFEPEFQWNPDTISTCLEWYNNGGSDTCEHVRSMFAISPEEFHEWNPSVGTDCKPWRFQSYCIFTKGRLASLTTTTTTAKATPTTTATSSTHEPSPTSWNALGCFIDEDVKYPAMEFLLSSDDPALQIKSCEDQCWKASNSTVLYAGVKQGNQCWCSSYVGGQISTDQKHCNIPCSGNKNEMCGGKNLMNAFEPVTTTVRSKTATMNTEVPTTSVQSSGAMRNIGMF